MTETWEVLQTPLMWLWKQMFNLNLKVCILRELNLGLNNSILYAL